jgi:Ca2+-binding RTX toxin-like protein
MGELYQKMAAGFAAQGGVELTAYNDAGGWSTHGAWGMLDSIYDDGSPRYDALAAIQAAWKAANTPEPGIVITGTANADRLTGRDAGERIMGLAGNDTLFGGRGEDTLDGGAGDDSLSGGEGNDPLIGGDGNDIYRIDDVGDVIVEAVDGGLDQVYSTVDYALDDNVENLRLSGAAEIDATGNALANYVYGNAAANRIIGLDGNDTLRGMDGSDVIEGGNGDDVLAGDGGNDSVLGGDGGDRLNGGDGNDTLVGGAGSDTLTGNAGADRFVFGPDDLTSLDIVSALAPDSIVDFVRADGDRIDLAAIDAKTASVLNEAFVFVGSAAFSGSAGELRAVAVGMDRYQVSGDVNGDALPDFAVNVFSHDEALSASDFIL